MTRGTAISTAHVEDFSPTHGERTALSVDRDAREDRIGRLARGESAPSLAHIGGVQRDPEDLRTTVGEPYVARMDHQIAVAPDQEAPDVGPAARRARQAGEDRVLRERMLAAGQRERHGRRRRHDLERRLVEGAEIEAAPAGGPVEARPGAAAAERRPVVYPLAEVVVARGDVVEDRRAGA